MLISAELVLVCSIAQVPKIHTGPPPNMSIVNNHTSELLIDDIIFMGCSWVYIWEKA